MRKKYGSAQKKDIALKAQYAPFPRRAGRASMVYLSPMWRAGPAAPDLCGVWLLPRKASYRSERGGMTVYEGVAGGLVTPRCVLTQTLVS